MYVPQHFKITDSQTLYDVIDRHGFATLINVRDGMPVISHIPLLLEKNTSGKLNLLGHFSRANDHWKLCDGKIKTVAIFHGSHDYISPRWYETSGLVPTWNYIAVHVTGAARIVENYPRTIDILKKLTAVYETGSDKPWTMDVLDDAKLQSMLKGIVAFEMPIDQIEGKFKLSQNRTIEDRMGVINGLKDKGGDMALDLADRMK